MAAANRLEARFSRKHAHTWVGYKVHLSEICEESQPHLITQVATAISTSSDIEALPQIHQGLADKSLLPSQHLVDTGYISAEMLVESRETHQVDLVGPARQDYNRGAGALAGTGGGRLRSCRFSSRLVNPASDLPPREFVSILDCH